ncbi:MAG: glycosyltransferase family 39 protein [Pseudomonadota bacterium]
MKRDLYKPGLIALILAGIVLLLPGIGTGIWDPWEMDRAHLARQMAGRTKLLVVESRTDLAASLRTGAGERFFIEEVTGAATTPAPEEPESPEKNKDLRPQKHHRSTVLKRAAKVLDDGVYHAVLVHESALRGDPAEGAAFMDALVASHPGVEPILVAATRDDCDALFADLEAGQVANALELLADDYPLLPEDLDRAALLDRHAGTYPFKLLVPCVALDEGDDATSLVGWLDGIQWTRVTYRAALAAREKAGKHAGYGTFAMPPLDAWLTGLSYEVLGFSETSSRLPGVLMGLLTLLIMALGLWRLAGARVAFLSVAVAVTTPMFLGQAKNMAGEISYTLFLTGGVLSFALLVKEGRLWWLVGLLGSAVLLFLAKGLFALGVLWLVVTSYVVILADLRRAPLVALGILTALFAGLAALVLVPTEWTFFAHFKFMAHPFNGGPIAYFSWFDFFLRQVGFGAFPWTILLPFAFGALALRLRGTDPAEAEGRRLSGLIFLWFTIPFVAHSAGMTDFRHLVFPAITALGPAVALLWLQDAGKERSISDGFIAVGVVGVAAVVLQGLLKTQEPAVNWLTVDPLMSSQAAAGAEEVSLLSTGAKALVGCVVLLAFLYYARLSATARAFMAFFRRPLPAWITLWVLAAVWVLKSLVTLLGRFGGQTPQKAAGKVAPQLLDLPNHLLRYRLDLVLLVLILAALGLSALVRYTRAGGWVIEPLRRLGGRAPLQWLGRAAAAARDRLRSRVRPPWLWLLPGLGLLTWALTNLLVTFPFAPGSAERILAGGGFAEGAAVLAVALVVAALVLRRRLPKDTAFYAAAAGLGLVLLTLAGRIQAATDGAHWDAPVLLILGAAAWAAILLPWLLRTPALLHGAAWGLGAWIGLSVLVPLVGGWTEVELIIQPDAQPPLQTYLLWSSRTSQLLYLAIAGVLLNIGVAWFWGRVVASHSPRFARSLNPVTWLEVLERPEVNRFGMLALTLVFAGVYALQILPGFARSVSQKHIIETYLAADGRETLGDNIFKHQGTDRSGDDRNFYTAPLPALANQNDLLEALTLTKDTVFKVKRSSSHPGPEVALRRAWSDANDADGDGRRDHAADAGLATEVGVDDGGAFLVDGTKAWEPDQWAGHVLVDWRGKTTEILGNDGTRLRLAAASRVEVGGDQRGLYRIDHADATDHDATAMETGRTFVVMDQQGFSEINYKFRKKKRDQQVKAGVPGAQETAPPHIPVIEGDNNNFLLAASSLAEGEENENPFALATITQEEFEAMEEVEPAWVDLDGKIRLEGYRISKRSYARGEKLSLDLFFRCTGAVNQSYKIFMHIDAEGSGNRINGDHWPLNRTSDPEVKECVGCWKTSHWMEGDLVIDHFETEVPLGTPSGRQNLWMGLYLPGGGNRMKVKDWDRKRVNHDGHDRFRIGSFEVH